MDQTKIEQEVAEIKDAVLGNPLRSIKGVLPTLERYGEEQQKMREEQKEMRTEIKSIREEQEKAKMYKWLTRAFWGGGGVAGGAVAVKPGLFLKIFIAVKALFGGS